MFSCAQSENSEGDAQPLPDDVLMVGDYEFVESIAEDYDLIWTWEGDFTADEQEKLKTWITDVNAANSHTLGPNQFDIYVNFIRSESKNRPVPFGFASRKNGINQVNLYVNPSASAEELMEDWTAQHEFSHLSIPYLGSKHKWFSEGFATFLSRQTMMDQGFYTQTEFDSLYHRKISEAKEFYNSTTKTFIEVSDSLMQHYSYSHMYWGGSTFFFTLDKRLRDERSIRFVDIMKIYQLKYRSEDRSIKDVIASFDRVIGESWCIDLMKIYRNEPSAIVMENY
jgi:hypothetical protein